MSGEEIDRLIVEKFIHRDEEALKLFSFEYGALCRKIVLDITQSADTAEECFNDTLLRLWNSIPPEHPRSLKSYACRIIRNLSLHELEKKKALKRTAIIVELEECADIAEEMDEGTVREHINQFLYSQPKLYAYIFVRRFFYAESVKEISKFIGYKTNKTSKILAKMRKDLKKYLSEGGIRL